MLTFVNDCIKYDYNRCQQCGACIAVCPTGALTLNQLKNGLCNIEVDHDKCIKCQRCVRTCPANKVDDFGAYFSTMKTKEFFLAHNRDEHFAAVSSSGGVARTLIIESLKQGLIDGVYSLRRLDTYPSAVGEFYTPDNIPSPNDIPNSVYHSVMQCLELAKVKKVRRLMVVGTACQLRALDVALKGKFETIIKVCIFCKQQKSLGSTRFLAKISGTRIHGDGNFTAIYRGNGWPGFVRINNNSIPWHRAAQIPFGRRLWTVPGCNVCGDPYGFIAVADISLMDPWTIESANDRGNTLVTVNTPAGRQLLDDIEQINKTQHSYNDVLPALSITDIRRKQALVPYFRGEKTRFKIRAAGRMERLQRACLKGIVTICPRMPMIFYRALCKLPDWRNIILGK